MPFEDSWVELGSVKHYESAWRGPFGCRLCLHPKTGKEHASLTLNDSLVSALGEKRLAQLLEFIEERVEVKCTRLDLAFNNCCFTPIDAHQAWTQGNVTGALNVNNAASCHLHQSASDTVYFGARSSNRTVRIYNLRGHTRLELQLRKDKAERAYQLLFGSEQVDQPHAATALGLVVDFIRFIDRSPGNRPSECESLPWWGDFVGSTPKTALPHVERPAKAETTDHWLQQTVAKLMAKCALATDDPQQYLRGLFDLGRSRLKDSDWLEIEEARMAAASTHELLPPETSGQREFALPPMIEPPYDDGLPDVCYVPPSGMPCWGF